MSVTGTPIETLGSGFAIEDEAASDRILGCPSPLLLHSGGVILKESQKRMIQVEARGVYST
jgi:hypothetical protein